MSVLLLSCSTNDTDQIDLAKESFAPDFYLADSSPGYINAADLATAQIGITIDVGHGEYKSAVLRAVYSGDTIFAPVTVSEEITSLPFTQQLTASDLVSLFPGIENLADIEIGDVFTFYSDVTLPDGTVIPGRDSDGPNYSDDVITSSLYDIDIAFGVGCPSDLEGEYTVVSSMSSTDGGALDNPTVDFPFDGVAVFTKSSDVAYEVTNGLGGMYTRLYGHWGAGAITVKYIDVCGTISDNGTIGSFGAGFTVTSGSVDDSTGVITVEWINGWGDTGKNVYTPVN